MNVRAIAVGAATVALVGTGISATHAAGAQACTLNIETGALSCGDQAAATAAVSYNLATLYDGTNYTGSSLTLTGPRPCTTTYDPEYVVRNLGTAGWSNRASSVRTWNNCDIRLFDGTGFSGAKTPWIDYWSNLGSLGFDNRASSVKIS